MNIRIAVMMAACTLLAACGDMKVKVWPFGDSGPRERSRDPANATDYQCAAGKRFFVRMLDGGDAAWLILPEREVRLDRVGGNRYGKGSLVLELGTDVATVSDGASTTYADCKPAAPR